MVFDQLAREEYTFWMASIATLCKALAPEVDAALYPTVEVASYKQISCLSRSLVKRPYRALPAVQARGDRPWRHEHHSR